MAALVDTLGQLFSPFGSQNWRPIISLGGNASWSLARVQLTVQYAQSVPSLCTVSALFVLQTAAAGGRPSGMINYAPPAEFGGAGGRKWRGTWQPLMDSELGSNGKWPQHQKSIPPSRSNIT